MPLDACWENWNEVQGQLFWSFLPPCATQWAAGKVIGLPIHSKAFKALDSRPWPDFIFCRHTVLRFWTRTQGCIKYRESDGLY